MRIKKLMLAKILREELSELENPRHRGGSHERSAPAGEFEPPENLLLAADADEDAPTDGDCDLHSPGSDNAVAIASVEEINSLASKIASLAAQHADLPDWVDFKLSSSLTNLHDIYLYLKGHQS